MATTSAIAPTKTFDELHGNFCKEDVFVRLIHSWEARNIKNGNILMGVEVLLMDSKGFISANRLYRFKSKLKADAVYKLRNFIIRPAKRVYRVSANAFTAIFTDQTSFDEEEGTTPVLPTQKFRIQSYQAFVDIADTATDLYDIIGHIRLINGENIQGPTPLSTPSAAGGRTKEMVFLHVQLEDGETVRVYLWGDIAAAFRGRWNRSEEKPAVVLITTLNPKTLAAVSLSSTASTRLFFDKDVDETSTYITSRHYQT